MQSRELPLRKCMADIAAAQHSVGVLALKNTPYCQVVIGKGLFPVRGGGPYRPAVLWLML